MNESHSRFDLSSLVKSFKSIQDKKPLSKFSSLLIIVVLIAFLIPLPHSSYDHTHRIQSGIDWPYGADTELELDYEVSSNSSIWWHDQSVEINISIIAVADISKIGRFFNLTYVLIALNIENSGIYFLVEEELNGTDGVFLNASISGNNEVFEKHRSYEIQLDRFSSMLAGSPKLNANLEVILEIDWIGHAGFEMTTPLSNFRAGTTVNYVPTPFPILLDNPQTRISGILVAWSLLFIPLVVYLVVRLCRRSTEMDEFDQRLFFWIILGLSGIYVAIVLAVTLGPLVSTSWFPFYSIVVTVLIGLPISYLINGLQNFTKAPFSFLDQYRRYQEICTLTGIRCRIDEELSESPLSWKPYQIPRFKYDLVSARIPFLLLVIECILIVMGSTLQPSTLFIQQLGALGMGIGLFGWKVAGNSGEVIDEAYYAWDLEWYRFWLMLDNQVLAEEIVFDRLGLFKQFRKDHGESEGGQEIERICQVLNEKKKSIPKPEIQPIPESIKIGLLTWYVIEHLNPKLEELSDDVKSVLKDVLLPFTEDGIPWTHRLGSGKLLRRVIFSRDAYWLAQQSPDVVTDFADLILDDNLSRSTDDNIVKSKVTTYYNSSNELPRYPQLQSTRSVLTLLAFWSIFSAVFGLLVSSILIMYI